MAYKQGGNPLSRKSSPLNAKNPFNRVSPINNTISGDKLDLKSGNPSIHPESEHNPPLEGQPYPNPDFHERQSDMEESGADQPDYESDDYKPGISRKSSPFNHATGPAAAHSHKDDQPSDDKKKNPPKREKPKKVEKVAKSYVKGEKVDVKGKETKGASEVKITKKVTGKPKGTKTAKDAGVVDSSGREGTNRQERKKRRKERKAIRKDKTLSRSQKTMAKKESREKQKDNNKKEKSTSSSNSRGGMMRKSSSPANHLVKEGERHPVGVHADNKESRGRHAVLEARRAKNKKKK